MNTRRYPRSTMEAFHRTAEYGAAIERPYHRGDRAVAFALAFAAGYMTFMALFEWLA